MRLCSPRGRSSPAVDPKAWAAHLPRGRCKTPSQISRRAIAEVDVFVTKDKRNGNVERVYDAVRQGVSDRKAIATWVGIDEQAVTNALYRLIDAKRVRKDGKLYVPNTAPTLAQLW